MVDSGSSCVLRSFPSRDLSPRVNLAKTPSKNMWFGRLTYSMAEMLSWTGTAQTAATLKRNHPGRQEAPRHKDSDSNWTNAWSCHSLDSDCDMTQPYLDLRNRPRPFIIPCNATPSQACLRTAQQLGWRGLKKPSGDPHTQEKEFTLWANGIFKNATKWGIA